MKHYLNVKKIANLTIRPNDRRGRCDSLFEPATVVFDALHHFFNPCGSFALNGLCGYRASMMSSSLK